MRHHLRLRRTAIAMAGLVIAATGGLAACGVEDGRPGPGNAASSTPDSKPKDPFAGLSGAEIAAKAVKATSGARSLRMAGRVADRGVGLDALDVTFDAAGRCAGTVGLTRAGSMQLIVSSDTVYRKYDEGLLRAAGKNEKESAAYIETAVDLLAGRWSKTSTKSPEGKAYARFCDLNDQLASSRGIGSTARKAGTTTVGGTPALKLIDTDGKDEVTLYVATKGTPYLLKVDQVSGGKPEKALTFSDYDKPVKAKPPTGEVLDLDQPTG
ncbi:hypothetical protein AB0I84_10885 [Streptomyces spectabilis]|uniref:hypothetical protein n=1 Tax=Streptomyces spectabilis TaxID=68270 RepID=UPI003402D956